MPRRPASAFVHGLSVAVLLAASACGGGGGGGAAGGVSAAGGFRAKPEGGWFFQDEHRSGHASRLALVEITWGRLVDVHAVDGTGAALGEPVMRDFVINENLQGEPGNFVLETSPITQKTRLVVQRVVGAPDDGRGTFEALLARAALGLPGVLPRSESESEVTPFSFVARNACLVLRFDDLLADDEEHVRELADDVRLVTGYPPRTPHAARLVFDPNHGGIAGGRFHSTRVLVDLTVTEAEAADSPVPLALNSLGLPRSERLSRKPNVVLRLPTRTDPGSGQFTRLVNLSGRPVDPQGSRPYDGESPTLDLVRAVRAGNEEDTNNGFLLDFHPPRVVGTWPCAVTGARALDGARFEWSIDLDFSSVCYKAPGPPDIVAVGERFLEVTEPAEPPDAAGRTELRARVLNATAPEESELIGLATYQTLYRAGLDVERGCWLRFAPAPRIFPAAEVHPEALTTVRFSEPVDPNSARPFDSLMTLRGPEDTPATPDTLVVGRLQPSLDLRELTFLPSVPYAHRGERPIYAVRIPSAGGVTDLAGNELLEPLPDIQFSIDPTAPFVNSGSFVLRFDSPDELEPIGFPDLRGQFTYDFFRGAILPRAVVYATRPVDRSNPIVSIMSGFPPGVATPLSPLGSKLQAVWRYADLGWSIRDETKYNLDVIGLYWSPARGLVTSDFYEELEILLAHSTKLPDEQKRGPFTGGMKYPVSGLWEGPTPFRDNILLDPDSPQVVMHERALGYRVNPGDLSFSPIGTPLMPWPVNRGGGELVSFTWRDTAVITRGGQYGAGVPMDSEVGPPLGLENTIGSFAPAGQVPTVGLPLLIEVRCYPSQTGIGLNPLAINLASNISAAPNFRAYSTGGFDTSGMRVTKNPDLEPFPTGGFNPGSRPPGKPTARTADNALYLGAMDYVIRISRVHTIWIDSRSVAPHYTEVVVEPGDEARPPGTRIQVDFRGAERFVDADNRPFNAGGLTPYGDPRSGTTVFHRGDPTWKSDVRELDGARYLQLRFSFVNNIEAGLVAELSAVGVAFGLD